MFETLCKIGEDLRAWDAKEIQCPAKITMIGEKALVPLLFGQVMKFCCF